MKFLFYFLIISALFPQFTKASEQTVSNEGISLHGSVFIDVGPEIQALFENGFGFGAGVEIGFERFSIALKGSYAEMSGLGADFTTIKSYHTINVIVGAESRFYFFGQDLHGLYLAPDLSCIFIHSVKNIDDDIVVYTPTNHLEHTNYNLIQDYPVMMTGLHIGYKFGLGPLMINPFIGGMLKINYLSFAFDYGLEIGYGW